MKPPAAEPVPMLTDRRDRVEPTPLRSRVFSIPTLLSFGVAAGVIALLTTRFDLDWGATWDNVRGIDPWMYGIALLLYYASFLFRGLRWRLLAINAGAGSTPGSRPPSVLQSSQLIVIGWFVNSIAWLRLGDAYRAYAFARESRSSFSWSLGTVLAERTLDMALIFGILVIGAGALAVTSDAAGSGPILIAGSAMAAGLAAVIVAMRIGGVQLARLLPSRIAEAYAGFHEGTMGSFKQLPGLVMLGLSAWVLEMGRLYFVIAALDMEVALALIPVLAVGHAILSTVPTPGGLGAVEPGLTGLLLLSLDRPDAVSVALVDRSITYVSVIVIGGLVFLLRQIVSARQGRIP